MIVPMLTARTAMIALALGPALVASAEPGPARQRAAAVASQAEKDAADGKMREALGKFKHAARLDPGTPAYVCNIGLAYYSLSDMRRAHLALSRCRISGGVWPAGVKEVFDYVEAELERRDHAAVSLASSPPEASIVVEGLEDEGELSAPIKIYLPPGDHGFRATADGYQPYRGTIRVIGRGAITQPFVMSPVAASAPAVAATERGGSADPSPVVAASDDGGRGGRDTRIWGWTSVGVGGALMVGGGVSFLMALSTRDEIVDRNRTRGPDNIYDVDGSPTEKGEQLESQMERREAIAWALGGLGLAAAGAGVFLLVTADDGERPRVGAAPVDGGGLVVFSWER